MIKTFLENLDNIITPRDVLFLGLTLILFYLLRLPSLIEPYWYGDEAIYLTLGEGIRHNLVLYRDIFDHKPPLIYLIAAAAGSLYWFKLILLVWSIGTIALFWKLARETVKNYTWQSRAMTILDFISKEKRG